MSKSIGLTRRKALFAGVGFVACSATLRIGAADAALQEGLSNLGRLIGRWRGKGEGQPGSSDVERTFEATLGGQFLIVRNRSVYPPQQKNPSGETHEDLGIYSFDKARRRVVFRQFHVEGFVNQYVAAVDTAETTVFESEALENIASGWRARETYRFLTADTFEEVFELAEPGREFVLYSQCQLRRA